jgi:UDP-N-acetylmuramate--alanine ligase
MRGIKLALARLSSCSQLNSAQKMSDFPTPQELLSRPFFFVGIGGSGMLPLAQILKGRGADVAGSDRSLDQGRTPEKFAAMTAQGFTLVPQDGSGITSADQIVVASAAIEDSVPEIARARALGCLRMTRAELNSILFNTSGAGIAIAGTSGKSTVTGMLGWIMQACGREPTVMNGAVMKNFVSDARPFASSVVGGESIYVSEVDESDGSIALYRPAVGVLLNVSLDHKSMDELRVLFGDYLGRSRISVINADNAEALALLPQAKEVITFGIEQEKAQIGIAKGSIAEGPTRQAAMVIDRHDGSEHALTLALPGRHNLSNALAAIAGAAAAGIPVKAAVAALSEFAGLARRFDIVGTSNSGVTVIDDFGHNPEKCAATLRTLKAHKGRVLAFFQPHGYGPLRQMGAELAETFANLLDDEDLTILCDPVYFGGTVDRSEGSERIIGLIEQAGGSALHIPSREEVGEYLTQQARAGDRIVIMGARDDTLSVFARDLLAKLG